MDMKKSCEDLARRAPKLTSRELRKLNDLFPSYIFRRRKTGEVWTTCCGRHETLPLDHPVMRAEHTPEPRPESNHQYCHSAMFLVPPETKAKPEPCACPFCGKVSPVKELGRTGKRDNLAAFRRAAVLRWYRGALWAVGYYLKKSYQWENLLTDEPTVDLAAVYRFVPGKAEAALTYNWWRPEWSDHVVLQGPLPRRYKFPEPFKYCEEYGTSYDLVNAEEMDKSPFKWCGIQRFKLEGLDYMRYLALCTAYPRQVEMLLKAGLKILVTDFCFFGKRNARVFNWDEPDPCKSFGLSKEELREFLANKPDPARLATYKALRRKGVKVTFWDLLEMGQNGTYITVAPLLPPLRLSPARLTKYLKSELNEKTPYLSTLGQWWKDYIDAARVLGYDLTNPVFLLPKGLKYHHDRATKAALAIKKTKADEAQRERERKRLKTLAPKYTYSDGRWLIRPPVDAAEIVAEGKALRHCVGGYAARHVDGKTTILFLRDRANPGKPLVTIEMHGTKLAQIHGWDDERSTCKANPTREDPRKLYAEFLDPWLEWVAGGSKRDKKGYPIIKKKSREESVA